MFSPSATRLAKWHSIDHIIDMSQSGFKVDISGKRFGAFSMKLGLLEFWYDGNMVSVSVITLNKGRKYMMDKITKDSRNLIGEKYFVWKPND